jgi:ankyrin repeat protein
MRTITLICPLIAILAAANASPVADPQGRELSKLLLQATAKGRPDKVKSLIKAGADINITHSDGKTPLDIAMNRNHLAVARLLVEERASILSIHADVFAGNIEKVRSFIDSGTDVDAKDKAGVTPLLRAVSNGQFEMAQFTIANGADVDAQNEVGWTSLHIAADRGFREIVELLIAKGADVNLTNHWGLTPLQMAERGEHREIVRLLGRQSVKESIQVGGVNARNDNGQTPLHLATEAGIDELARELLAQDVDVDVKDIYGRTPLHCAAAKGYKGMIQILLKNGARIEAQDVAHRKPIRHVVRGTSSYITGDERIDIIQLLLNEGANVNAADKWDTTPLHDAVNKQEDGHAMIRLLIGAGANLQARDSHGYTPFLLAQGRRSDIRGLSGENEIDKRFADAANLLHRVGYVYYVATDGSDLNPGTIQQPFRTVAAAIHVGEPGDSILIRDGIYNCAGTIRIDRSGEYNNRVLLSAYRSEEPVLKFSKSRGDGLLITGSYWHIKGSTITDAGSWGIRLETKGAHHNILEQITAHANGLCGITIFNGAAHNLVLNCDSYKNFDPPTNGEHADGFAVARAVGEGNILLGCRTWNNSDDGFDFWHASEVVRLEHCYACRNGQNIWNLPFFAGNANGFRLGQGEGGHILIRCASWNHPMRGFDLNVNTTGVTLYNCTAFGNKTNFDFTSSWRNTKKNVFRNCISFDGNVLIKSDMDDQFNSWNDTITTEIDGNDFMGLDSSDFMGLRNPDGSIPAIFG